MSNIKPTLEQQKIINSTARLNVVEAGPGTGKSTTLAAMIRHYLIARKGQKILYTTYNKQNALEFGEKHAKHRNVKATTLHALGYQIIQQHYALLDYSEPPTLLQGSDEDQKIQATIRRELKRLKLLDRLKNGKNQKQGFTALIKQHILDKLSDAALEQELCKTYPLYKNEIQELLKIKSIYKQDTHKNCQINYDQQITLATHLLENYRKSHPKYDLLLVDEAQDLNESQYQLLRQLEPHAKQIVIVGDSGQSIYGFRGALDNIFKRFKSDYPNAKQYQLTQSFRCSQPILNPVNAVRAESTRATALTLHSDRTGPKPRYFQCPDHATHDAKLVKIYNYLLNTKQIAPQDIAVLARMKLSLYDNYTVLVQNRIPAVLGSPSLLTKTIEVFKAVLTLSSNPTSEADLLLLITHLGLNTSVTLENFSAGLKALPQKAHYLFKQLNICRKTAGFSEKLIVAGNILTHKKYGYKAEKRFIERYSAVLRTQLPPNPTLKTVLQFLNDFHQYNLEGSVWTTIHSAKGREFKAVIFLDVVDGFLPDRRAFPTLNLNGEPPELAQLEAERNLLYVALSRAKDELFLLSKPRPFHNPHSKRLLGYTNTSCLLSQPVCQHLTVKHPKPVRKRRNKHQ